MGSRSQSRAPEGAGILLGMDAIEAATLLCAPDGLLVFLLRRRAVARACPDTFHDRHLPFARPRAEFGRTA